MGHDVDADLGDIEPASMLGCVVHLQPSRYPARLFRRERLIEGVNAVRIQIVHDKAYLSGVRLYFVD